jgi:hypothetical protein
VSKKYTDTFCIEFDTKEMPGKIVATQVVLKKWVMGDADIADVSLRDHPLYPKLAQYVFNNPPPGYTVRRK